jgi:hypothetical protein
LGILLVTLTFALQVFRWKAEIFSFSSLEEVTGGAVEMRVELQATEPPSSSVGSAVKGGGGGGEGEESSISTSD